MTNRDDTDPTADGAPSARLRLPRVSAGTAGLLSLFLAASVRVVPLFGALIAPLGLIPVLHFQAGGTSGIRAWGWVTAVLIASSVLPLGSFPLEVLGAYVLIVALPAATVELWARWGWSEGRWALVAVASALVVILGGLSLVMIDTGPVQGLTTWFHDQTALAIEMYNSVGVSTGQMELAFDATERAAAILVPGAMLAYFVVIVFWVRPRIPVLGYDVEVRPFEEYRNDDWLAAGFAVAGLGALFLTGLPRWLSLNLLIAVLLLYFVQGLAMIRAHLARWVGRGWFVRWGIALMCIYPPMPVLVATLGVADSFLPLRPRTSDDGGQT